MQNKKILGSFLGINGCNIFQEENRLSTLIIALIGARSFICN